MRKGKRCFMVDFPILLKFLNITVTDHGQLWMMNNYKTSITGVKVQHVFRKCEFRNHIQSWLYHLKLWNSPLPHILYMPQFSHL